MNPIVYNIIIHQCSLKNNVLLYKIVKTIYQSVVSIQWIYLELLSWELCSIKIEMVFLDCTISELIFCLLQDTRYMIQDSLFQANCP